MPETINTSGKETSDGRVHLSFGAGVDNRSHLTRLAEGYVREADNVEIDAHGIGRMRDGYQLAQALPGAHSLWTHPLLTFALVADASALYRMDADGTLTALVHGLNGSRVSYAVIGQRVHWSNGVQTGALDLSATPMPGGMPTPSPSFGVAAVANGGLFAGRYGVTLTFGAASREEGGAPDTVYVDVPDGGGIQLSNVPTDPSGAATEARVYVTTANGTELFYAGSALPGVSQFLVGAGSRTRLLTTQFCEPFPAATHLLGKSGRLFGAVGRRLVWSQPLYFGLWRPTENSMLLPDEITMIAAPDSSEFLLYVGTRKKVYLLMALRSMVSRGESLEKAELSVASAAGVIEGSMVMAPAEMLRMQGVLTPIPLWVGSDGVPYAGTVSGVVPMSSQFAYPVYDQAAAAVVQQNGLSRYIVSGRGGRTSGLAMTDSATATVIEAGP